MYTDEVPTRPISSQKHEVTTLYVPYRHLSTLLRVVELSQLEFCNRFYLQKSVTNNYEI